VFQVLDDVARIFLASPPVAKQNALFAGEYRVPAIASLGKTMA
jgi:hypothetical protein